MNNIKNLKPKINSFYKQGYINTNTCKKLFESCKNKPIIYRSNWEKIFIGWCERNKNVKKWGSECISIPYINILDKTQHTYYPDFVLEMIDGKKIIVEVKPKSQTMRPKSNSEYEIKRYLTNKSKWITIKKWCEQQQNTIFWIVTEETINKLI